MHDAMMLYSVEPPSTVGSMSRPKADPKTSTKPYLLEPLTALESVSRPIDTCGGAMEPMTCGWAMCSFHVLIKV